MKKINVYVDETIWRDFRIACMQRDQSASQMIERLMREQLERWKAAQEHSEHRQDS